MSQGLDSKTARDLRAKSRSISMTKSQTTTADSVTNMAAKSKGRTKSTMQYQQTDSKDSMSSEVTSLKHSNTVPTKVKAMTRGTSLTDIIKMYEASSNCNTSMTSTAEVGADQSKQTQSDSQSMSPPLLGIRCECGWAVL